MTWSYIGAGSSANVASGLVNPSFPVGGIPGDLYVCFIAGRGSATFTAPSGWTMIEQTTLGNTLTTTSGVGFVGLAYHIRGAVSGPAPANFTRTGGDAGMARVMLYRSSLGSPVIGPSTSATDGASATSHSYGGITTAGSGALILAVCGGGNNDLFSAFSAASMGASATGAASAGALETTNPSSSAWSRRANATTVSGADTAIYALDAVQSSSGATGNFTVTSAAASLCAFAAFAVYESAPAAATSLPPTYGQLLQHMMVR